MQRTIFCVVRVHSTRTTVCRRRWRPKEGDCYNALQTFPSLISCRKMPSLSAVDACPVCAILPKRAVVHAQNALHSPVDGDGGAQKAIFGMVYGATDCLTRNVVAQTSHCQAQEPALEDGGICACAVPQAALPARRDVRKRIWLRIL